MTAVESPTDSAPEIVFTGVRVSRGGRPVIQGVDLIVSRGETLALVGRSGAGKSTLLKLVNRLLEPDEGEIVVGGRPTTDWSPYELRRQIGYVLQEIGLFPHLSVRDNIAVVPRLLGWETSRIDSRVDELLDLVGLAREDMAGRWPHELSGGQRQRVGVARALAADPAILLMDEPFGALDPMTRSEIHREFKRIQARVHKTIVLVTHDMAEAFALASRIGVIADGSLVALDTPAAIAQMDDERVRPLLDPLLESSASLEGRA